MEGGHLIPDEAVYNSIISAFGNSGDSVSAAKWLVEMRKRQVPPNNETYAAVIRAFAKNGQGAQAARMLQDMELASFSANARCYTDVIRAFSKAGDVAGAQTWFEKMHKAGIVDKFAYSTLIRSLAKKGQIAPTKQVFDQMIAAGFTPDVDDYTALVSVFAKAGNYKLVDQIFETMLASNVQPNAMTWGWAVLSCVGSKGTRARPDRRSCEKSELVFRTMIQSNVAPNSFVINALDKAVGRTRTEELCAELGVDLKFIEARPISRIVDDDAMVDKKRKDQWKHLRPYHDGGRTTNVQGDSNSVKDEIVLTYPPVWGTNPNPDRYLGGDMGNVIGR